MLAICMIISIVLFTAKAEQSVTTPLRLFLEKARLYGSLPYLKTIYPKKSRDGLLRNCFFSPVQCLLPIDNKSIRRFEESRFES
ncbi:hypothetical protein AB6A40_003293 [Gnathostoma spinigerum]|uniref:Secreted protein n=1 Tax=Gnathostoma spinigerum TaxID=75299 RepID=A0ABD6EEP5_9BILA